MAGMIGMVIRKDGTVPFDEDVPNNVQMHILGTLVAAGHDIHPVKGTKNFKINDWKGSLNL